MKGIRKLHISSVGVGFNLLLFLDIQAIQTHYGLTFLAFFLQQVFKTSITKTL